MGRPSKTGLDYFSLDCVLDDKVDLLEAELGLEGFAILIKLWMKIYSNGYYIEWSDDIELLFARKINSEKTLVSSVINSCFSRKILNKILYEKYSILTSKGIQNRFFTACKICKRKTILVNSDFILVNPEEIGINPDFIEFTQGESTQKKRKERKVKETIYQSDSDEIRLSELLLSCMKKNNPNCKDPSMQSWAKNIDLMIRIDRRDPKEIERIINWCQDDEFWKSNILSTGKLRDKYDQLYIKMKGTNQPQFQSSGSSLLDQAERAYYERNK